MSSPPITVLTHRDGILAIAKPPGLPATGKDLHDRNCAQFQAIDYLDSMAWALHQIDRDTSGILLFADKKSLVKSWQSHWASFAVDKIYVALVHGRLPEPSLYINAPLKRAPRGSRTPVIVSSKGQSARTQVLELGSTGAYSLIAARLLTGRTHQIRAHLQHIGCPLMGEGIYNSIPCGFHPRQALHALAIRSRSPLPNLDFEAPFPEDLRLLASRLGLSIESLPKWASFF